MNNGNGSSLKWFALAAGAVFAYAVVTAWPEIRRYRRMRAM
jgi:hypothetical protein